MGPTTKSCNTCKTLKPLEHFHRNGSGQGRRGKCKLCIKKNTPKPDIRMAPGRSSHHKPPEYPDLTHEMRLSHYREAIARMNRLGLMSTEYAREAMARVNNLNDKADI